MITEILQATTLEALGYNLVGVIATLVFLGVMRLGRKSRGKEIVESKTVKDLLKEQHRNTVFDAVELVKSHIKRTGRYDDRELQTKIANLKIRKP
jgi:hypothetical protein